MICPDATIIHHGGASERVRADKMVRLFQAKANLFRKHWGALSRPLGILALDTWALTRMLAFVVLMLFSASRRDSFETWRRIFSRRAEWHAPTPTPPIAALQQAST
jgi:hypothetical protein